MGMSSSAGPADLRAAVGAVLADAGWELEQVAWLGTSTGLADDDRLVGLGPTVVGFDRRDLLAVAVPTRPGPAALRFAAPPVAEAAALLAAGPGGRLVVPKRTGRYVTVAAALGGPQC
ncbi:MAG TPA: cobalamin biosynthesis protein [Acidimicrobiales bacterium]|nr:cobalamin biosynthesis protein [Acidimicrobiales bacterium]